MSLLDPKKRRRFYTAEEVALHNCAEDCWVSIFGSVYDLTEFLAEHRTPLAQPIVLEAGKDISHWFDEKTGGVKTHVDPETNLRLPYLPMGRFCHVPPPFPSSAWRTDIGTPWWKNPAFRIGRLSRKTRRIRITNALTRQSDEIIVPTEETIAEIQDRYLECNAHAGSYTWKCLVDGDFRALDMGGTLLENRVVDEEHTFKMLDPPAPDFPPPEAELTEEERAVLAEAQRYDVEDIHERFIPELLLMVNDDLTVA